MKRRNIHSAVILPFHPSSFRLHPLFLFALIFVPRFCLAWGDEGHQIVAAITERYLTLEAHEAIAELLPDQSLVEVAAWADNVRRLRQYEHTSPYHFVNIRKGAERYDAERDCGARHCAVWAIEHYASELRRADTTPKQKPEALKFLVHFVGDIHQPLHVSYAEDQGGNLIHVKFFSERMKLHAVWDGGLIKHRGKSWQGYAVELIEGITDAKRRRWEKSDPVEWANESFRLAVKNAYAIPSDGELGKAYYEKNIKVVNQRLSMAGVRLAAILNSIFTAK